MRLAAAIGVIAVTLAAAGYVHQRNVTVIFLGTSAANIDPANCRPIYFKPGGFNSAYCSSIETPSQSVERHPSWEDPVAVLLALGGVAAAAGILTVRR